MSNLRLIKKEIFWHACHNYWHFISCFYFFVQCPLSSVTVMMLKYSQLRLRASAKTPVQCTLLVSPFTGPPGQSEQNTDDDLTKLACWMIQSWPIFGGPWYIIGFMSCLPNPPWMFADKRELGREFVWVRARPVLHYVTLEFILTAISGQIYLFLAIWLIKAKSLSLIWWCILWVFSMVKNIEVLDCHMSLFLFQ